MRKIKLYCLGLVGLLSIACSDLEEVPTRGLTPEGYFNTAEDVETMILGTYGLMASSNYYGSRLTGALQLMSDMIDLGFDFSDYSQLNSFIHTPTNSYVANIWKTSYQIILTANSALDGVDQIENTLSQEDASQLRAEAMFVRAFMYYHLVRLYGEIPYIASVDLGDPLEIKKSSVESIYTEITNDLLFAFENLPTDALGGVRSRPSKGAAATLLASVYLTRKNYEEAYEFSKWVIDNSGSLGYGLENDFQDLFRAETQASSSEYIFYVDFLGNQTSGGNPVTLENDQTLGAFNGVDGGAIPVRGWSMLVPSLRVYETWDSMDYRRFVSMNDELELPDGMIHPYADFNIPRPHAAKLNRFAGISRGNTAGWRSDLDYVVFRYAEVLLIAAESANELGNTSESIGYVNLIRERARQGGTINSTGNSYGVYPPSSNPMDLSNGLSQSELRNEIIEERRIELAFEFKRWYDIVRLDLGTQVFGSGGLEPQPNFNPQVHYLLPIPQEELDKNPNLGPQNPGY